MSNSSVKTYIENPTTSSSSFVDVEAFRLCRYVDSRYSSYQHLTRNNYHEHNVYAITSAITSMAKLPKHHFLYIDHEIASKALDVFGVICDNTLAPMPKILNESGEALSFTWEIGGAHPFKRYLTIDNETVELSDYPEHNPENHAELADQDGVLNSEAILQSFGGYQRSESTRRTF